MAANAGKTATIPRAEATVNKSPNENTVIKIAIAIVLITSKMALVNIAKLPAVALIPVGKSSARQTADGGPSPTNTILHSI